MSEKQKVEWEDEPSGCEVFLAILWKVALGIVICALAAYYLISNAPDNNSKAAPPPTPTPIFQTTTGEEPGCLPAKVAAITVPFLAILVENREWIAGLFLKFLG